MNLELNQKSATSGVIKGLSAGVGAVVSKGAMSVAPAIMQKPVAKILIGFTAFMAAASIQGDETLNEVVKGSLFGAGIQQTAEGVVSLVKTKVDTADTSTKAKKFVAGALAGLEDAQTFELPPANLERRSQVQGMNTKSPVQSFASA